MRFWSSDPPLVPRSWTKALTAEHLIHVRGVPGSTGPIIAGTALWQHAKGLYEAAALPAGWKAIHVTPSHTIWAVGTGGKLARFSHGSWELSSFGDHTGIDICAWDTETWVPVSQGEFYRDCGEGFALWAPPEMANRNTGVLWGAAPNDVWVHAPPRSSGKPPELGHWDGSAWSFQALSSPGYVSAIHGSARANVWAAGWTAKLLGKGALLAHFDGQRWVECALPLDRRLSDVFAVDDDTIWVVGDGVLMRGDRVDGAWSFTGVEPPDTGPLISVWATADGTLWVASDDALFTSIPDEPCP